MKVSLKQASEMLPASLGTLYQKSSKDDSFPRPVERLGRVNIYLYDEIEKWASTSGYKEGTKGKKGCVTPGMAFGKLKVVEDSGERSQKAVLWTCECECGNMTKVVSALLLSGKTRSCGCLRRDWPKYKKERK